jgi:NAD(P)-dependent dehydrogenase (short-subunit alcohol dehydrogenase family)
MVDPAGVDANAAQAARATHELDGRVVIITGSGQGVGRGMAHHIGKAGAGVVVAEWKADRMQSTVDELTALGVPAHGVEVDISERDQVDAMVASTLERFGRVDALINNAQTFRAQSPVAEVTEHDFDVMYRSGVKGSLWAMQAVYPHMKAAGWGRMVNFASSMGITGGEGFAAYNASKEAIRGLTRTAAREWARDGIVVNAIAPAAAPERARGTPHYEEFMRICPMQRQGDPEWDIGPVAAFLCSDACRFLTGQTFMVDGGAFMWA